MLRRSGRVSAPLLTFVAVGLVGFAVDAIVMTLLVDTMDWHPVRSRAVSFPLAVTTTWLLNRRLTFPGRGPASTSGEYLGYVAIQLTGAGVNVGVFLACLEIWPILVHRPVVPLAVGAVVALVLNFGLLRGLLYRRLVRSPVQDGRAGDVSTAYAGVENLEVMAEAVRYNAYLGAQIRFHLPRAGGRVMDFGAGSGTFAMPLHDQGIAVTCVEPDEILRERLRMHGLEVARSLDDLPEGHFAMIYSLNVLEHIDDDRGALEQLRAWLGPEGLLLLYVPAFQFLYSSMDRKVGHFRRYRKGALIELVERAGLSVERARYVDSIGFLAALAYRVLGNDDGSINRQALAFYDRWIFPVSLVLDRIVGRWFGKNVLVVATAARR